MKLPLKIPLIKTDDKGIKIIKDLITNQEVNDELNKIDNLYYPYWDKFKYKVSRLNVNPEYLWFYNKILRSKSHSSIKINELPSFDFKLSNTSKISHFLHLFDMNLGGFLEAGTTIAPEDKDRFLISSIMEEAIASSQLEGAVTTREVAKEMLKTERKPRNISERMILNNYLTIKKVIEVKEKKLSKDLIKEIHRIISKNTLDQADKEGVWRTNDNVTVVDSDTGEIVYVPPSHELLDKLMDDFCAFVNKNHDKNEFIHPIVKAIILHFLIGYIHPFVDGNGRTARAIFYWYLVSKGYWLVEYLSISRIIIKSPIKYARSYLHTEYDGNDLTYFIHYNLRAMNLAMQDLQSYISRKVAEKKSIYSLIKNENFNERQAEIIKDYINFPNKTLGVKEVQNQFAISYQTARTDLDHLVKLEYLQQKLIGKKLLFFRVSGFNQKIKNLDQ